MTTALDNGSTKQVVTIAPDIPNGHRMEVASATNGTALALDNGSTKQAVTLATDVPNGHRMEFIFT